MFSYIREHSCSNPIEKLYFSAGYACTNLYLRTVQRKKILKTSDEYTVKTNGLKIPNFLGCFTRNQITHIFGIFNLKNCGLLQLFFILGIITLGKLFHLLIAWL